MWARALLLACVAAGAAAIDLRAHGPIAEADPTVPGPDPNDEIQIIGNVNGVETIGESYETILGQERPQAEPHLGTKAMNTQYNGPTGHTLEEEIADPDLHRNAMFAFMNNHDIYKTAKLNATKETKDSRLNGDSNKAYIEQRKLDNEALPENVRHKTLTEIWKKELPCECPFNQWKPVCGVDGNTYPTSCFADCIGMPVFVHADCKYVKRELWARVNAQGGAADMYEECEEHADDAESETRPKCRRPGLVPNAVGGDGFGPDPESDAQLKETEDDQLAPEGRMVGQFTQGMGAPFPEDEDESQWVTPEDMLNRGGPYYKASQEAQQQEEETQQNLVQMGKEGGIKRPAPPTQWATAEKPKPIPVPIPVPVAMPTEKGHNFLEVEDLERRLGQRYPGMEHDAIKKDAEEARAAAAAPYAAPITPAPTPATPPAPTTQQPIPGTPAAEADEEAPRTETRVFHGMAVPFDTREVENPCPQCPTSYKPACGVDGRTYPTACFAKCLGTRIAKMGECDVLQ